MQQLGQRKVIVSALIGALGLSLCLNGCSSSTESNAPGHVGEPGPGGSAFVGSNLRAKDSNGPESDDSQDSGMVGYAALGEGQRPPPDLGLLDTQGLYDAGAEATLSYNFATHTFTGQVENLTRVTLRQVRVVVHLSNGTQLGPTDSVTLAPGQVVDISIPAGWQLFTHWSAYLEVG